MKNKYLQISIDGQPGGLPVHVTPVDVDTPESIEGPLEQVIALGDLMDAVPGDGILQYDTKVKLKIRLFGRDINIDLPVRLIVKLVEK